MKFNIGDSVTLNLTEQQKQRLGISEVKNPCKVTGFYTNGTEGYYLSDATGKTKAVPESANALSAAV